MAREKEQKLIKYACCGKRRKVVRALERGERVNSTDHERRSALFHAALRGNKACLKELLSRGANTNQRDSSGYTPCHAAAMGGSPPSFPPGISSTRNPVLGAYLIAKGTYSVLKYWLHDRAHYRSCLCYLLQYGGDLGIQALSRETVRDVAVRMRKMAIVELIEDHYDIQTTLSGYRLKKGQSMLRPTTSYPRSCPRWMHTVTKSNTIENMSPLNSQASLYQRGRKISCVFDYGYVHAFGHSANPGAMGAVPEILPAEILPSKANVVALHGSTWSSCLWAGTPVTVQKLGHAASNTVAEQLVSEMDHLSLLRHPNITLLMAVCCGPAKSDLCLVLEPVCVHSLHDQLHHGGTLLSEDMRQNIAQNVASALVYLHTVKGTVHCLISSFSVHLHSSGVAKVVNLHSCCSIGSALTWNPHLGHFLPWMAPELISKEPATCACDIYSLGVLIWELCSHKKPWDDLSRAQVVRNVLEGHTLPLTEDHASQRRLLKKCFEKAKHRPPAQSIMVEVMADTQV